MAAGKTSYLPFHSGRATVIRGLGEMGARNWKSRGKEVGGNRVDI